MSGQNRKRVITPVTWLAASDWLTPEEAAYLSGHSVAVIRWLMEDGAIETNDAGLIDKTSLHDYQECLLLVSNWPPQTLDTA
jgi:hypothetical protein